MLLFSSNQDPIIINIAGDNVVEMIDLINKDIIKCRSRITRVANNDSNFDGIAYEIETIVGYKDIFE